MKILGKNLQILPLICVEYADCCMLVSPIYIIRWSNSARSICQNSNKIWCRICIF